MVKWRIGHFADQQLITGAWLLELDGRAGLFQFGLELVGLDALGEVGDRDALELVDPFLGAGHYSLSPSGSEVSSAGLSASGSAGLSASGFWLSDSGSAASPTRPCSWIWPSAIAIPDSSALR